MPSVTAVGGTLDLELPSEESRFVILEPVPAVVAGESPDSPANRVDPNTTTSPYAGVVSLSIQTTLGNYLCSGTLVSLRHVVSAAHCLDVNDDGLINEVLAITVNVNYGGSPSHQIAAASWVVHPDWTGFNNPSINDDVSVITLATALPAGVPTYPLFTGNPAGQVLTLVGYSQTGTPSSGYLSGSQSFTVKRVGQNVMGAFVGQDDAGKPAANEVWRADFDGPTSATNTLADGLTLGNDKETTLGGGDSGGPAFIKDANGQLYLAGINTLIASVFRFFPFQVFDPPAYGSALGGTNVAAYASWIQSIISAAPDTQTPAAPTGLVATPGAGSVTLDWANSTEPDLAGYNVYRSTSSGGPYSKVNSSLVTTSAYTDTNVLNGTTYFYVVTAVDTSANESDRSNEASATPAGSGGGSDVLYFTVPSDGTVGGLAVANEDILVRDGTGGIKWFFDGSAFGLGGPSGGFTTDAVAVIQNGGTTEILLSFAEAGWIGGTSLPMIRDEDVVRFTVTAFGPNGEVAAGSWALFFDGSDVGLSSSAFSTNSAESIDAIDLLPNGRLLISTKGGVSVPGVSAQDEDILFFTPTSYGANTAGSWALYFDGTGVGLGTSDSEDVDGVTVAADGKIYLSTVGNFTVAGASGSGGDVFAFSPPSGPFTPFLSRADLGLGSNLLSGVSFKTVLATPLSRAYALPGPIPKNDSAPKADSSLGPNAAVTAGRTSTSTPPAAAVLVAAHESALGFRAVTISPGSPSGASRLSVHAGIPSTLPGTPNHAAPRATQVEATAFRTSVVAVSALTGEGIDAQAVPTTPAGRDVDAAPTRSDQETTPDKDVPPTTSQTGTPTETFLSSPEWRELTDAYFSAEQPMALPDEQANIAPLSISSGEGLREVALAVVLAGSVTTPHRESSRQWRQADSRVKGG